MCSPTNQECRVYGRNYEKGDCLMCKEKSTCAYHERPTYSELRQQLTEAMEMLDNVLYWETCPQEYVDRILRLQGRLKEVE